MLPFQSIGTVGTHTVMSALHVLFTRGGNLNKPTFGLYLLGSIVANALGATKNMNSALLCGFSIMMLHPHSKHPIWTHHFSRSSLVIFGKTSRSSGPMRVLVKHTPYQKRPTKAPRKLADRAAPITARMTLASSGTRGRRKRSILRVK